MRTVTIVKMAIERYAVCSPKRTKINNCVLAVERKPGLVPDSVRFKLQGEIGAVRSRNAINRSKPLFVKRISR